VIAAGESELAVATGEGVLEILHLQPAGKRSMPADQFLRGYPVQVGDRFGEPAAC
ncbi:MAG: methionyl-tRNA formyltransferase, partial [Planctomycetales bacterium]|nr:methionyl-tRNA formyltransferase [Planctomycetales bacterium]